MRVKASENRLFWSLGRGEGDTMVGVELFLDMKDHVRRTVFSRGKYGKESVIFEEEYSSEEFMDLLDAEKALLSRASGVMEDSAGAKSQLLEAMERIRRVYDGL